MCLVILAALVIVTILLMILDDPFWLGPMSIVILPFFLWALFLTGWVLEDRIIDSKIELYTQENAAIEEQIDKLVSEYMEFESGTFEALHNESAITLVSLYPELKSDKLVESQINIYLENNRKIRDLKEDKLDITVKKWWLYFGS